MVLNTWGYHKDSKDPTAAVTTQPLYKKNGVSQKIVEDHQTSRSVSPLSTQAKSQRSTTSKPESHAAPAAKTSQSCLTGGGGGEPGSSTGQRTPSTASAAAGA